MTKRNYVIHLYLLFFKKYFVTHNIQLRIKNLERPQIEHLKGLFPSCSSTRIVLLVCSSAYESGKAIQYLMLLYGSGEGSIFS